MFSLMGNCISSARARRQPKKSVTFALLGIDNAGKTTASYSLSGESIDGETAPTVGFRNVNFAFDRHDIRLYDIGGGKNIRPVWKTYFPEVHGVIFMVDSSTADRMEEAQETFKECLGHPHVSGKPVLLLANKQDKPDALDEVDICEMLNLETVVNSNKCPCRIDACSALRGTGKKMDRSMKEGLRWLLVTVESHWEDLNTRVESDTKIAEEARKAEMAARRERVRKLREERERTEEEERSRLGVEKKNSDDEDIVDGGDPFKRLDLNQLKQKEDTMKAEKKRQKELKASQSSQDAAFTKASNSSRSQKSNVYKETESGDVKEGERICTPREDGERVFSPRSLPSTLPHLKPLGTPFLEDGDVMKKKKKKKRTPRNSEEEGEEVPGRQTKQGRDKGTDDDDEDICLATPRSQPVLRNSHLETSTTTTTTLTNIRVSTHDDFPSRQMLAEGITRVPRSLDGGEGEGDADTPSTRKVKKKKLRQLGSKQNGQAGRELELSPRPQQSLLTSLDGGDINANGSANPGAKGKKKVWRNSFKPTEEEAAELSARGIPDRESNNNAPADKRLNKLSRHSQMHSNVSIESDPMGSKTWGLAEDLPIVADDAIAFRKPNVIDDIDSVL
ncbi:hypothetical protein ACOMHN_028833 [Nucella lapillus]